MSIKIQIIVVVVVVVVVVVAVIVIIKVIIIILIVIQLLYTLTVYTLVQTMDREDSNHPFDSGPVFLLLLLPATCVTPPDPPCQGKVPPSEITTQSRPSFG